MKTRTPLVSHRAMPQSKMLTINHLWFALLIFWLVPILGNSQSSISGIIKEGNGQPVAYANILLLSTQDSSLVKGELSDSDGKFKISNISKGDYILSVRYIGYNESYQTINLSDTDLNVPPIILIEGVALEEVQIVAKKPLFEQKIDRLIVNVANTITAAGGSALEVLERSPGVIVNQQSNAISLIGKEGVVIMINDKISYQPAESILQLLAGMPADNIETIELITTPPANFDAEGNAGYINIKLKQRTDLGLNGNASVAVGYGEGETGNSSFNLNYRKGIFSAFANYNFSLKAQDQYFYNYRKVFNGSNILENEINTYREPQQINHNLRLGADFELSSRSTLGVLLTGYNNKWSMDANNDSQNRINNTLIDQIELVNQEVNHWKHYGANINYEQKIGSSGKININVDYLNYNDDNPNTYDIDFLDENGNLVRQENQRSSKITPIDITVSQLDYSTTLNEKMSLVTGIKIGHSEFINTVSAEVLDGSDWVFLDQFTNESNLTEDIIASFASIDYNADSKNAFKIGLRYEYTDSKLNTIKEGVVVDRQYGNLFPSIFYTRTINEKQSLNLSYSRRITRPTFNDMAPFAIFLDPNTFFFGNAAIQPAISNTIKADYRINSYLLTIQYSRQDSTIARFQDRVDIESNQQLFEPVNLSYTDVYSASLSIPIYIGNAYTMQNNLILIHNKSVSYYEQTLVDISNTSYNINSSHSYRFDDSYSIELNGFYNSAAYFGRSKINNIYGINFGAQKKLKNGSALRFNIRDVLNSIEFSGGTDLESEGFVTDGTFDFSNRTFSLSYSFNFGNSKLKSLRQRQTASEDERNRVN